MNPGGDLEQLVRQRVATLVDPELVDKVTWAVGMTLATLMADPRFTDQLRVVADLRQENMLLRQADVMLRQNIMQLQRILALKVQQGPVQKVAPRRKKAAPKSASAAFKAEVRRARR